MSQMQSVAVWWQQQRQQWWQTSGRYSMHTKQNGLNIQNKRSLDMPDLWDNWKIMRKDFCMISRVYRRVFKVKHGYWCWHLISLKMMYACMYIGEKPRWRRHLLLDYAAAHLVPLNSIPFKSHSQLIIIENWKEKFSIHCHRPYSFSFFSPQYFSSSLSRRACVCVSVKICTTLIANVSLSFCFTVSLLSWLTSFCAILFSSVLLFYLKKNFRENSTQLELIDSHIIIYLLSLWALSICLSLRLTCSGVCALMSFTNHHTKMMSSMLTQLKTDRKKRTIRKCA